MIHLAPTIKEVKKDKKTWDKIEVQVPIYVRYNEIMEDLNAKDAGAMTISVREKLLGVDLPLTTPDVYQEIAMLRELGLLPYWDKFEMQKKARIIAQYRLNNMVETYRRYLEILDEGEKSKKKDLTEKSKGRGGRRGA
jgi:hypothetical protein